MSVVEPGTSVEIPEVPDGLYDAVITEVKDVTLEQADQFGNTEKVQLTVAFTDSEGEAQTLSPRVNRKWGEKANLFKIALACGIDANPYDPFDTDDLKDKHVKVLVETDESDNPNEKVWPRIKSWSRIKGKSAAKAPAPEAAPVKVPSVVDENGAVDYDAFWRIIRANGLNNSHVVAHVGGDIEKFMEMDGHGAQQVLEELIAIANS